MANRALRKYLRIRRPSTREKGAFPDLKRRVRAESAPYFK
jgi:hypothetical protein